MEFATGRGIIKRNLGIGRHFARCLAYAHIAPDPKQSPHVCPQAFRVLTTACRVHTLPTQLCNSSICFNAPRNFAVPNAGRSRNAACVACCGCLTAVDGFRWTRRRLRFARVNYDDAATAGAAAVPSRHLRRISGRIGTASRTSGRTVPRVTARATCRCFGTLQK